MRLREVGAGPLLLVTRLPGSGDPLAVAVQGGPGSLSNEEIERILTSKIELPRDARLALRQLGGDARVLMLPAADGAADAMVDLFEQLGASERLSSVTLLPSLLVPPELSVAKLREAAARFQADLLFVYRTPCQRFHRNRFLGADEARA